jgi:hypothetical protein
MTKRILICAMRQPRRDRTQWFGRRMRVIAGLVVADLALVGLASGCGHHDVAFFLAWCIAPLGLLAMPRSVEPPSCTDFISPEE